jgi:hypothetical protein
MNCLRCPLTLGAVFVLGSALVAAEPRSEATQRAYRPVIRPKLPEVRGACRTDIDRFILSALEAKNATLNPEADRATLIRRVCFDLTGLPPTAAELDAFLADRSPDAYEKMVDRYLASPRRALGETLARRRRLRRLQRLLQRRQRPPARLALPRLRHQVV